MAAGVLWPNTGHSEQLPQHEGVKAVFQAPASVPFTGARGDAVLLVEQRFVEHAVFRHDVAAAFDLVAPSLRGSITRARRSPSRPSTSCCTVSCHSTAALRGGGSSARGFPPA